MEARIRQEIHRNQLFSFWSPWSPVLLLRNLIWPLGDGASVSREPMEPMEQIIPFVIFDENTEMQSTESQRVGVFFQRSKGIFIHRYLAIRSQEIPSEAAIIEMHSILRFPCIST